MKRETYTREEVVRLLRILYKERVYTTVSEDDAELLRSIGFDYGCVENGHGGYCVVRLNSAGAKEIFDRV